MTRSIGNMDSGQRTGADSLSVVQASDSVLANVGGTEGTRTQISVIDSNAVQLLGDILAELRKLNLHMSLITDTHIRDSEV